MPTNPASEAVSVLEEILALPVERGATLQREFVANLAQQAVAKVEAERDAWKREWRAAIDRISGPTNEIAARETAQYILQTLQRWRDGRKPAPLIVDPQLDAESFVVIIKNAISSRTDELQSKLATLEATIAAKDAEIATLRTACEAAKEILDNQEAQEALNVSKSPPLVDLYDDRGAALKKIHEALNETSVPPKGE